jgi:hypothetical protein
MGKVTCKFINSEERGTVSYDANHDEKYYKKYRMNFFEWIGCDISISIKDLRYINWSDKTGFIRSGAHYISSLAHKNPRRLIYNPRFFDHTTYWRKTGDRWPSFCLTEPYTDRLKYIIDEIEGDNELISEYNLKIKIFMPSEQSLWYPNSTAMIFIWNPDYFDFDANRKLLMSHEDASEFEKKLVIEKKSLK